jgi:hypothetical protein
MKSINIPVISALWICKIAFCRYYDTRLSDQQMALLQYQRQNIHYLSEEVFEFWNEKVVHILIKQLHLLEMFIFLSYVTWQDSSRIWYITIREKGFRLLFLQEDSRSLSLIQYHWSFLLFFLDCWLGTSHQCRKYLRACVTISLDICTYSSVFVCSAAK